jgi:hypothetical protein
MLELGLVAGRVVFEQQWLELELVIAEQPDRHHTKNGINCASVDDDGRPTPG